MKKIIAVIVVILLALIVWGVISLNKNKDTVPPVSEERQDAINEDEEVALETINVKHQYKDGMHTFVGTIDLPTPCHSYNVEMISGDPALIKITINEPGAGVVCAQVITPRTFKATYESVEDRKFTATINGEKVNLNLFELDPDENIDTYELYIKG